MLEMQRIGWVWTEPFTIVNDGGQAVVLTQVTPKAFAAAAADGVRRRLARDMAGRYHERGGARVA